MIIKKTKYPTTWSTFEGGWMRTQKFSPSARKQMRFSNLKSKLDADLLWQHSYCPILSHDNPLIDPKWHFIYGDKILPLQLILFSNSPILATLQLSLWEPWDHATAMNYSTLRTILYHIEMISWFPILSMQRELLICSTKSRTCN